MRKLIFISCLLLAAISVEAQQFIGCREGDGWAETAMVRKSIVLSADDVKHYDFQTLKFNVDVISLGYHEVYVNGLKVGDNVMQPAVSQLNKKALQATYNITKYVHKGKNEIILYLGQGWGRVYGTPAAVYVEVSRMIADVNCGHFYTLAQTDSTWEASPLGYGYTGSWQPLQFGGERFDARVKPEWRPASIYDEKGIDISNNVFKGNHIVDTLKPKSVMRESDNAIMIDFGRVITGWFQADFSAMPEGHEVTMEYLDHKDAKPPHTETDIYIADNSGIEHFSNRFHTHAFRYVRIKGADVLNARALQISAVNPREGATFECSDTRLNAIHDMVKYTLSCLTFSGYMVDCPHLERMGYGGDGNSSTMTLQTLWDVRDTYRNWLTAWSDAMEPDGELPYVAPAFRTGGGPYWSGFIIKAPWRTYLNYGDRYIIVDYYDKMKRWLDFVERNCEDYILQPWPDNERHSWFLGDWLAPEGVDIGGESVLHVSSCFIAECLGDMVQMAHITGRPADSVRFAEWRQCLKASIHRHFYHPESHTYANGTPLDQAYALLMGIPPDSVTAKAVKEQLLKDCHEKYRDHIAGGLMGVPVFTEWCIQERQTDLMATILRQPDYPGYLYMINNGATTTWESWDCGREGKEDRSRVHNCYNGIGIWFYQALAGIRPDPQQPGYKHFYIDPQPCEGIEWVKASKPTRYGDIKVEIKYNRVSELHEEHSGVENVSANTSTHPHLHTFTISIPEGTTATIFPGTNKEQTLQAGQWTLEP